MNDIFCVCEKKEVFVLFYLYDYDKWNKGVDANLAIYVDCFRYIIYIHVLKKF